MPFDLIDYRRRVLSNEPVNIDEMREAIMQLRINRTIPQPKATKSAKAAQPVPSLDDILGDL